MCTIGGALKSMPAEKTLTQCHGFEDCPCDEVSCHMHGAGSFVSDGIPARWSGPYIKEFGEHWRRGWIGFLKGPGGKLP